jgi:hypothetical protein
VVLRSCIGAFVCMAKIDETSCFSKLFNLQCIAFSRDKTSLQHANQVLQASGHLAIHGAIAPQST